MLYFQRVIQSNSSIKTDDSLVLTVSIVMSKSGGVRRKVRDLAHDTWEERRVGQEG